MCRSDTFSLTVPARRSTEPEIFTFDRIPEVHAQAAQCARPAPPRRRAVRVLYPSTGRRYLPRAERSPAKRWLLALCLVVLLQIYAEDDVTAAQENEEMVAAGGAFASAEEEMKAATAAAAAADGASACSRLSSWRMHEEKTCPERAAASLERWSVRRVHEEDSARARARNGGYVVALLYPVYHKLGGSEQ